MYAKLRSLSLNDDSDFTVRHFTGVIEDMRPEAAMVETELFPRGALEFYTKKNMGWSYEEKDAERWLLAERGGDQGDYRFGMPEKIANVVDCLRSEPRSKRAVIPIPFADEPSANVDWTNAGQTKCCRELYLYVEDNKLHMTGVLRMQNANIFPKNIHFFATLMQDVAHKLGLQLGTYTHFIINLCHDRNAISC